MIDEPLPLCPVSGKISFPTKRVPAEFRKYRLKKKDAYMESYQCRYCPYYHLTKGGIKTPPAKRRRV